WYHGQGLCPGAKDRRIRIVAAGQSPGRQSEQVRVQQEIGSPNVSHGRRGVRRVRRFLEPIQLAEVQDHAPKEPPARAVLEWEPRDEPSMRNAVRAGDRFGRLIGLTASEGEGVVFLQLLRHIGWEQFGVFLAQERLGAFLEKALEGLVDVEV